MSEIEKLQQEIAALKRLLNEVTKQYQPPKGAQVAAKRALKWIADMWAEPGSHTHWVVGNAIAYVQVRALRDAAHLERSRED